jgi:hypothetical protein
VSEPLSTVVESFEQPAAANKAAKIRTNHDVERNAGMNLSWGGTGRADVTTEQPINSTGKVAGQRGILARIREALRDRAILSDPYVR